MTDSAVIRQAAFRARLSRLAITGGDVLAVHGVEAHRGGTGHVLVRCPSRAHDDAHPSCSVNVRSGRAHCFGCGFYVGDVVALHAALGAFASMGDAIRDLERHSGLPVPELRLRPQPARNARTACSHRGHPVVVNTWIYRTADGSPAFEVVRIQFRLPDGSWFMDDQKAKPAKVYLPAHPGGHPRKMPSPYSNGSLRPPFNLPAVLAAGPNTTIYVVEGEPCVDALASAGLIATTSSGGASNSHRTDWSPLAGRHVVIWPDNDGPGLLYADGVATQLARLTPSPRIDWVDVDKLGLPAGGDAVDWFLRKNGGVR